MFEDSNLLSVEEREARCYSYFHSNCIETRDQLRDSLRTNPIPGVRYSFAEDMFSDFLVKRRSLHKRRDTINTTTDHAQIFALSDMHIPFQDENVLRSVFDCMVNSQPQYLILLGDILDCYSILTPTMKSNNARHPVYNPRFISIS